MDQWREKRPQSKNKELYFQLHIAGILKHISRWQLYRGNSTLVLFYPCWLHCLGSATIHLWLQL